MDYFYVRQHGEYRRLLEDYLEIKFSTDKAEQKEVITQMMYEAPMRDCEIHVISGIVFNETLLVIKDDNCIKIKHLYVMDKHSKGKMFIPNIVEHDRVRC